MGLLPVSDLIRFPGRLSVSPVTFKIQLKSGQLLDGALSLLLAEGGEAFS